jgi:hypothetical protein
MKHFLFLGTVTATVGIGLVIFSCRLLWPPTAHQPDSATLASDSDGFELVPSLSADQHNEIQELKRQVQALSAQVLALQVKVLEKQDPKTKPAIESRDDVAATEAWREHLERVEEEFRQEGTDTSWSAATTEALIGALHSEEVTRRAPVSKVECHSKTCRVEITESGAVMQSMPTFTAQFQDRLPSLMTGHNDDRDGQRTLVLYMSRGTIATPMPTEAHRR